MPETASSAEDGPLSHAEVRVWAVDLDAVPQAAHLAYEGVLSPQERVQADRFARDEARRRYVVGRGTLRHALASVVGLPADALAFQESASGKPYLSGELGSPEAPRAGPDGGPNELEFNVSHAEGLALIAAARDRRVGVDVERMRDLPDADELVERFFSPRERDQYAALPDQDRSLAFFSAWTCKEALLKATGVGISHGLDRLAVRVGVTGAPRLEWVDTNDPMFAPLADYSLRPIEVPAGYVAHLAVEGDGWHLAYRSWTH